MHANAQVVIFPQPMIPTTNACVKSKTKCSTTPSTTPGSSSSSSWTQLSLSLHSKRWGSTWNVCPPVFCVISFWSDTQKILDIYHWFCFKTVKVFKFVASWLKVDSSITSFIFFSIKMNSLVLPFIMWMVTLSASVWYQWIVLLPSSRCSSKCCQRSRSNGKTIKWRDRREWRSWRRSSLVSNPSPGWRKTVRDKSWKCSWRKGNVFSVFI